MATEQSTVGNGKSSGPRVLIVGGGVSALMSALELSSLGIGVDLLGPVPASVWPAERAGGIDDGGDVAALVDDTLAGGGFLAAPAAVRSMAASATEFAKWLESIGVVFNRDAQGLRARRQLEGMASPRALFSESITTTLTTRCLDAQLLRSASSGPDKRTAPLLRRFEHHELVAVVRDGSGRCIGCIVQDLWSMTMTALPATAVILATAGPEQSFSPSASALCCESAVALAVEAGALLANADLLQAHPAILPLGKHNRMLLSGALRAEGARFWLPKDDQDERQVTAIPSAERDHFLEVSHPDRGNKLPDLEAARAIRKQLASGRGRRRAKEKKTQPLVCLDISHLPENHLRALVGSELDLCKQLGSANPYREPLWVQPGWVGRAGGLWVDHEENAAGHLAEPSPRNHSTNIAGLYASSTAGQLYHGSNRLSGNQLLAALFAGRTAARSAAAYCEAADEPKHGKELDAAQRDAQRSYKSLCDRDDDDEDNAVDVQRRLRRALRKTNFETDEQQLVARQEELLQLRERAGRSGCGDDSDSANSGAPRLRQLDRMLLLAELGLAGAQQRLSLKAHEPDLDDHGEERAKRPRSLLCRYRAGSIEQVDRCSYELLGQSISVSAQEHEHEEPER